MKNKLLKLLITINLMFTLFTLFFIFISTLISGVIFDIITSIILLIVSIMYNGYLLAKDVYYSRVLFGIIGLHIFIIFYGLLILFNINNSLEISDGFYFLLIDAFLSLITYSFYYFLDKPNWS